MGLGIGLDIGIKVCPAAAIGGGSEGGGDAGMGREGDSMIGPGAPRPARGTVCSWLSGRCSTTVGGMTSSRAMSRPPKGGKPMDGMPAAAVC